MTSLTAVGGPASGIPGSPKTTARKIAKSTGTESDLAPARRVFSIRISSVFNIVRISISCQHDRLLNRLDWQ
jgi:hypothetical protein